MVYGECRAMEFAFVRNGREEADREKIRAFAEAYGLVPCGELTGANIGEAMAGNYAGERPEKAAGRPGRTGGMRPEKAAGRPGRTGGMRPEKAAGRPGRGDTMIVADAAALGSRYEEALQAVSLAARQGISLYCVKEGLRIDALFPQTFDRAAEICLQLYKAVLSIRNKGIQDELKRTGKKRGRPFGTAAVSSLDGRNREIFDGLRQGLAKAEIARRLGVGRTTLYLYLKKNEDAGLRTGTDGAGRAGAGKNGGSGAGAGRGVAAGTGRGVAAGTGRGVAAGAGRGVAAGTGRGVAAGTGREVAAGAGRGEIGLQANKAIYDRNRT